MHIQPKVSFVFSFIYTSVVAAMANLRIEDNNHSKRRNQATSPNIPGISENHQQIDYCDVRTNKLNLNIIEQFSLCVATVNGTAVHN